MMSKRMDIVIDGLSLNRRAIQLDHIVLRSAREVS